MWFLIIGFLFLYIGLPLLGMTVGAFNLRAGYLSSVESERKKILWVVAECVFGTCMILVALAGIFVPELPGRLDLVMVALLPLAPLVLVLCLGIAVFYRGAIHPALFTKRAVTLDGTTPATTNRHDSLTPALRPQPDSGRMGAARCS